MIHVVFFRYIQSCEIMKKRIQLIRKLGNASMGYSVSRALGIMVNIHLRNKFEFVNVVNVEPALCRPLT